MQLSDVNGQMTEMSTSQTASAALQHTLQRHRDILHDYTTEYQKTKSHLQSKMERDDLLGSVRRDIEYRTKSQFFFNNVDLVLIERIPFVLGLFSAYKNDNGRNRRTDLYLKENEHLRR